MFGVLRFDVDLVVCVFGLVLRLSCCIGLRGFVVLRFAGLC